MLYMARSYGIELFFFTPADTDFQSDFINGLFFEDGKTVRRHTRIPPLIDNHIIPNDRETREYYKALRKRAHIPRHRLGLNKLEQYSKITSEGRFSALMIPTRVIMHCSDVIDAFEQLGTDEIVVKNYRGSMGAGIVRIEKSGRTYIISSNDSKSETDSFGLEAYFRRFPLKHHIAQPAVGSFTSAGEPFDIRIRVQRRNESAHYFDMYPRIGSAGAVTSNIHTGGYSVPTDVFLRREYGPIWRDVYAQLKHLGAEFPTYFQKFLDKPFFDLGLDVGIERTPPPSFGFQLRLFEINAFPGASGDLGTRTSIGTAIATFEYYHCLYERFVARRSTL
jgi:hypothetical protein